MIARNNIYARVTYLHVLKAVISVSYVQNSKKNASQYIYLLEIIIV